MRVDLVAPLIARCDAAVCPRNNQTVVHKLRKMNVEFVPQFGIFVRVGVEDFEWHPSFENRLQENAQRLHAV